MAVTHDNPFITTSISEKSEKSNSFSKKSSEKFSKREGIDENELMRYNENAVNEFGTTTDYAKAGFVLSDGRMLDLSRYGQRGKSNSRYQVQS